MHEAGVAERIVQAVTAQAALAGASRVRVVEVEAGGDSGVSEEAVRFHWSEASRGTPADGAELRIVRVDDPTAFRLVAFEVDDLRPAARVGRRAG